MDSADGGAAIILASSQFLEKRAHQSLTHGGKSPVFLGGGEASGPLYPPPIIDEDMFSCEEAARSAYQEAQLGPGKTRFISLDCCTLLHGILLIVILNLFVNLATYCLIGDIDFFGLYDCFPICLIRATEAVGLAPKGKGGQYIEHLYRLSEANGGVLEPKLFPVNTHGGLLAYGMLHVSNFVGITLIINELYSSP
jgi:hypothetical protein